FSLERFEDVRVDAALENGRVVLRYELSPVHPVTRYKFEGSLAAAGLDAGGLRRAIFDRYGATPPLGRVADMVRLVADRLRQRGYLHPTITPRADLSHDPEEATLTFTVDPGPRTTMRDVAVVGQ